MSLKDAVKRNLPVSSATLDGVSESVREVREQMLTAAEARQIHDELHWDVSVQLLDEVRALRSELKAHDEKIMMFAWEGYRRDGEALDGAKKRFFRSLPMATGVMRLLQLGCTKLLTEFDALCRENGINYFMACGTLLGAVRHGGFIPWDDDVDLGMMRDDISRLTQIAEDMPRFKLTVAYDGFVHCRQVRFRYSDESIPAFLDIFIFDWVSDCSESAYEKQLAIRGAMVAKMRTDKGLSSWVDQDCVPSSDSRSVSVESYFQNALQEERDSGLICGKSDAVGIIWSIDNTLGVDNFHWVSPLREIYPLLDLEFEGTKLMAPAHYMTVLTKHYGKPFELPNDIASHYKHFDVDEASSEALQALLDRD